MPLNLLKPLDTLTSQVHERSQVHRVAVTLSIVAIAAAARYALTPFFGDRSLWIFFYPAVLLAAWYGRLNCGLLATALSVITAYTLWVQPGFRGEMAQPRPIELSIWISIFSFATMGILISVLTETSHRAARAERRERNERERERRFFESALASSTDALVVLDYQWRIVYVNAVAAKIARKPRDQILGKVIWECCPDLRNSEFYAQIARCREHNIPVQFDFFHAAFDLWTEVRAFPMGEFTAFYLLDISARKRIENDLAEAQKKLSEHAARLERTVAERTAALQETVAELERFSYTISHDLRAPLRTLESFSQFIMEDYGDKLDAHGQDLLQRIRDAARRMDALINDVLLYSRTSRAELQIEPLDLDHLTRSIVSQYSSLNFSAANIEIKSPLGRVHANETMLTQTLSNLLHNAVKFVKPGQRPSVKVWSEPRDGHIRLFVQDEGIGIPAENQNKIFDIFQRAHEGAYEGTGIGLAIVKRAVERMNGTLGFVSKEGEGSTFWVELAGA